MKSFVADYSKVPLFDGLRMDEINYLLKKMHGFIKHFHKSDYIFLEGDKVESLCVVLSGAVQMVEEDVLGDKVIIEHLGPGSMFAENFLGTLGSQSEVSYLVATDSEILMLPIGKTFHGTENEAIDRILMSNIISVLADNNTLLIEKNEIISKKTLRDKIMAYLEQQARNTGCAKFSIPFSRTDLANYLDADRSALTRELARMREEGLITFEKNDFEIINYKI